MSAAATIVARIAGAERALACARAETLARTLGGAAQPWWDDPRACVAMLVRHGDPAVSAALDDTPAAYWRTAVPELNGHPVDRLRALLRAWWSELHRAVAGEVFTPTEAPPPIAAPAVEPAVPQGDAPTPSPTRERRLSRDEAAKRLGRLSARWFDPRPRAPDDSPDDAPGDSPLPAAWWEVAPDAAGQDSLWLVCSPRPGLDDGPRVLRLEGALRPCAIRRENLAALGVRVEASPARELHWSSIDPIPDTLRASLRPQPLAAETPTLFRTDIDGPSQRGASLRVAREARYAVLLPPVHRAKVPEARALDGGWALWSVDVPADPDAALAETLAALGITLGDALTDLGFVLVPPVRWSSRVGDIPYPVFSADPVVCVRTTPARSDLALFLHGPRGTDHHPLASIARAELVLAGLADGAYILELTARDPAVAPARLAFAIARDARGSWPRTAPAVSLDTIPIADNAAADLTDLAGRLAITAPPASRVRVRWEGFESWETTLCADADGVVPAELLAARTAPLRGASAEARLTLDFGDDGVVTLGHARTLDAALPSAREALAALVDDAGLLALGDAFLARPWAERAARALGFAPRTVPSSESDPVVAWTHLRLDDVRFVDGGRTVVPAWVLAVVPPDANLASPESAARRSALDALARRVGARGVVLTDGDRWWCVAELRSRLPRVDRISDALSDDDELAAFLSRYSAWR